MPKWNLHPHFHCSIIHNSQDVDRWLAKENELCVYIHVYVHVCMYTYYSARRRKAILPLAMTCMTLGRGHRSKWSKDTGSYLFICEPKKKQTHTKSNQICGYQKQGVEGGGVMQRWSECTNSQSEPDKNWGNAQRDECSCLLCGLCESC